MFGLTINIELRRNEVIAKCHGVKLRPIWLPSCNKIVFDNKNT